MRQAQVLNVFLVVIKREMGTCEGERGILPFSSVMRERRRNLPSPSKKKSHRLLKAGYKDSEIMTKHNYINSLRLCEV